MFADIAATQPIRVLSLRHFNPIGADPKMRTGPQLQKPSHALGKMMQAQEEGTPFLITGTDYPTRDGSGIRDYIDVWDLTMSRSTPGSPAADGPLVELAVGDGRVAIPVARATGQQVIGIDSSPVMLSQASARAAQAGVQLDLRG